MKPVFQTPFFVEYATDETYELHYDGGGHGGPYQSINLATGAARKLLIGCRSLRSIEVRRRSDNQVAVRVAWESPQLPEEIVVRSVHPDYVVERY